MSSSVIEESEGPNILRHEGSKQVGNIAAKELDWNDIILRILTAYNDISKCINPAELLKIELTSSQIKVLTAFSDKDDHTMTELSQALSVTLPTMTVMVDRLIQNGLVTRERDEHDRRFVRVRLTEGGRKMLGDLMAIRKQEFEKILKALSEDEIDLFLASIENVANLLSKGRKKKFLT
jgi:DNA-binding MarR family transcriptional regulator